MRRTTAGSDRAEAVARIYLSNVQKRQEARSHFLSALFAPLLFLFTLQISQQYMFLFALTLTLALLPVSIAARGTQRIDAGGGGIRADGTFFHRSLSSAAVSPV